MKNLEIVFLLDRSGSMKGSEESTIKAYNNYLKKEKENKYKTNVTTILFDDEYEVLYSRKDIKEIPKLTKKEYYVRGCTALMDAIGKTITNLEKEKPNKVLFVITTDGLENASTDYNYKDIQKLIKKHKEWDFIYIGADIDSYTSAKEIGIRQNNISNYIKDKKGIDLLFSGVSKYSHNMMCNNEEEKVNWKEELEEYVSEKKDMY